MFQENVDFNGLLQRVDKPSTKHQVSFHVCDLIPAVEKEMVRMWFEMFWWAGKISIVFC